MSGHEQGTVEREMVLIAVDGVGESDRKSAVRRILALPGVAAVNWECHRDKLGRYDVVFGISGSLDQVSHKRLLEQAARMADLYGCSLAPVED